MRLAARLRRAHRPHAPEQVPDHDRNQSRFDISPELQFIIDHGGGLSKGFYQLLVEKYGDDPAPVDLTRLI